MQIALVTGPAGVGKSTLRWEMSAQLAAAELAHAVIESDELDRVFPRPAKEALERLRPGTTDVLGAHAPDHVGRHAAPRPAVGRAAIPEARITVVRLVASEPALLSRLARREIGSGAAEQGQRSLRQAQRMANQSAEGTIVVPTDDRAPRELAEIVLAKIGWLSAS